MQLFPLLFFFSSLSSSFVIHRVRAEMHVARAKNVRKKKTAAVITTADSNVWRCSSQILSHSHSERNRCRWMHWFYQCNATKTHFTALGLERWWALERRKILDARCFSLLLLPISSLLSSWSSSVSLLWQPQQQQHIFKCTMSHRCETRNEIHTIQFLNWLLDTVFLFLFVVICDADFVVFVVARFLHHAISHIHTAHIHTRCRAFLCHFQAFLSFISFCLSTISQLLQIIHSKTISFCIKTRMNGSYVKLHCYPATNEKKKQQQLSYNWNWSH